MAELYMRFSHVHTVGRNLFELCASWGQMRHPSLDVAFGAPIAIRAQQRDEALAGLRDALLLLTEVLLQPDHFSVSQSGDDRLACLRKHYLLQRSE